MVRHGRIAPLGTKAASAFLLLVGCLGGSTTTAAAKPVKIVLWHIWGAGSPQASLLNQAIAEFNQLNKDRIEVEAQVQDFWTFGDKYGVAIASGIAPDVAMWDLGSTNIRAAKGLLVPLDGFIAKDKINLREFWPTALAAASWQGNLYAMPFNTDTRVFYYNEQHFVEAGLPTSAPVTWDDLKAAAAKLTRWKGGQLERVGFHPMWGNVWFVPWVFTNGGGWFDDQGNATINRPENVEALDWVVSWILEYGANQLNQFAGGVSGGDLFLQGKLSAVVEVNDFATRVLDRNESGFTFRVGGIPYRRQPASWSAGFNLEIPKKPSGHYEEAWELVKYLSGKEFMSKWTRARNLGARIQEAIRAFPNDKNWLAIANQMLTSRYNPSIPEVPDWWNITFQSISQALNLSKPPRAALEEAQVAVSARLLQARNIQQR